jgi:hypothetical protein
MELTIGRSLRGLGDGTFQSSALSRRRSAGYDAGMQTLVLAMFLLVSTVDARLEVPVQLLTEAVRANGRHIGLEYRQILDGTPLTLDVGPLPAGRLGRYVPSTRTITIAEATLSEDPRFVATVIAHELRHVDDADLVALGLLSADCLEMEARGFASQAIVARALWSDQLPQRTEVEQQLSALVHQFEAEGVVGLRRTLAGDAEYHDHCASTTPQLRPHHSVWRM